MSARWLMPLAMACLLAVPLVALKINRFNALSSPDRRDGMSVADLLTQHKFVVERHGLVLLARRDGCDMEVQEVAPQGWDRSSVKKKADARKLSYVYNGDVYPEQPAWTTWSYFHLRRLLLFLGWRMPSRPTYAIVSSGTCGGVDWHRLSSGNKSDQPHAI